GDEQQGEREQAVEHQRTPQSAYWFSRQSCSRAEAMRSMRALASPGSKRSWKRSCVERERKSSGRAAALACTADCLARGCGSKKRAREAAAARATAPNGTYTTFGRRGASAGASRRASLCVSGSGRVAALSARASAASGCEIS